MILNVFNPDHDMALANGLPGYTPPRIIQRMATELAWLPRLWTDEGVCMADEVDFAAVHEVRPWGWDAAIRQRLLRSGVPPDVLPDDEYIATVRRLSSRALAVSALAEFRAHGDSGFCGESLLIDSLHDLPSWPKMVVKAPWSSSGKGLQFVTGQPTDAQMAWCRNILASQGAIAAERMCDRRHDFAMEYIICNGRTQYAGLSLFANNAMGAYTGNTLAPAEYKMNILGINAERLNDIAAMHIHFLDSHVAPYYNGPVGIDMLVDTHGCINPCVEINLRRTMGHVALALEQRQGCLPVRQFIVGYSKQRGYFAAQSPI